MAGLKVAGQALLASALAAATLAMAQSPQKPAADDSPRFEIRRYVFDGAKLIPPSELEAATRAYAGPGRNFGDVQRALEIVERAYSERGYSAVQIVLPEQDLERGEVRFQITEAHIGRVIVEGNKFFDEANVRASVPALQPGKAPNINEIARNLKVANESPSKQENVLLRSGQEEATVDAVVKVVDEDPSRFSITVDNTGTRQTGVARVGFGYQNGNMFNGDNVLTMQFVTAPYSDELNEKGEPTTYSLLPSRKVTIIGVGYRVPLYELGDALDFSAGYSNVDSGVVQNLFAITGKGTIASARYTHNFDRKGDYEHRMVFSADYRAYDNSEVTAAGSATQLIPDVTVHPVSLLYGGLARGQDTELGFSFGYSKNFAGGNDGTQEVFCASRSNGIGQCADGYYEIYRWSFNLNRALRADWQVRWAMNGQLTKDMLVTGEQFGVGGMDSVRGFLEREITSDWGYRGTLEFYTPDVGGSLGITGARLRGVFFGDWGQVKRNNPGPAEVPGEFISSAGFGARLAVGNYLSSRIDFAWVANPGGTQGKGDARVHASISYVF